MLHSVPFRELSYALILNNPFLYNPLVSDRSYNLEVLLNNPLRKVIFTR